MFKNIIISCYDFLLHDMNKHVILFNNNLIINYFSIIDLLVLHKYIYGIFNYAATDHRQYV